METVSGVQLVLRQACAIYDIYGSGQVHKEPASFGG